MSNTRPSRLRTWWLARHPRADTVLLTQRNVYILPTRPGWMLATTLAVLLVASINYQLNLGYLLTFLLAGSALAAMHVGHATLRGLTLHLLPPAPQFAGAATVLEVQLSHGRKRPRHAIAVALRGADRPAWTDVPAAGMATVQAAFQAPGRGLHPVPPLQVETRFPLGIFRVWTVWRPAAEVLVYPAPEPTAPPLPAGQPRAGTQAAHAHQQAPAGEFDGIRAYRRGDPMKQVVWKKAARAAARGSDELVSRDSQHALEPLRWLDYAEASAGMPPAGGGGREQRLARLCAWVLAADRLGIDYGLRLPGREVAPGSGDAHRRRCLEALALC